MENGKQSTEITKDLDKLRKGLGEIEKRSSPPITVLSRYLRDISFEAPSMPEIFFSKDKNEGNGNIRIEVANRKIAEDMFDIKLHIHASMKQEDKKADKKTNNIMWICELDLHSIVKADLSVQSEVLSYLFHVEVPRLVWPFARYNVMHLIREGGFQPPEFQDIDFAKIFIEGAKARGFPKINT